ncbi:MAG TPA: transporter substrate-binding domain-containing protein [Mycobacterium sp.]|nr:transporter substrate-binding domain-containing protein [Mycobacterium sp.]
MALALAVGGCGTSSESSVSKPTSPVDVGVPVPTQWQDQGLIRVGIACDYPPFGYTDIQGKNAGYDADVARSLAAYAFGDDTKVTFTCVTPQNRIPYLETNKIDLIISTLGYTKERDETIDYSTPYFTSGAKLLVPADSQVTGWNDIHGKPVTTKTGTTSSTFLTNCYPDSEQLLLDSTSDAVKALKAGRAVAFAEDSTLLLGLTLNDDGLKVVGEDKAETPWGIGIRQGDEASKKWVDAALADMQRKDTLYDIFNGAVKDQEAAQAFAANMPRPDQKVAYTDKDTLADCS